ncbi:MAG: FHA domain-containing protein [Deltaproteobacteria bacterium]|nr:FHA domain-containing protein [Deltaproteobacteria bacterium]
MAKLHHPHAGLLLIRNRKQMMIPLTKDVTTIGRKQADIILDDPKVSARHAEVHRKGKTFVLIDLKSTNGTFLNRQSISEVELTDQDVIEVGLSTLCYFEDLREFHGNIEESNGGMRPKKEATNADREPMTVSKTLNQTTVELEILSGPDEGKTIKFKKSHITLGRSDADLVLLDLDISRSHSLIEVLGKNSVFVRDLNSTNGTLLNGKKIQSEKIKTGDVLTLGNTKVKVLIAAPEEE